jgi:thiamine biosynthesis lipoprotein
VQQYRQQFSSMGCPCEIRLYAKLPSQAARAIGAAISEIDRLDKKYSLYRGDSLLSKINRTAGSGQRVRIDTETALLLDYAEQEYQLSEGLFDITAGALWRVWDFHANGLPHKAAISAALRLTGWRNVKWQKPYLNLPEPGMALDLGGVAKEYAADCAAAILLQHDIQHGLVDLGGDISVSGGHPNGDGWSVGIKKPAAPDQSFATIELQSGGLATSGDYERFIEANGIRYGHIINPDTGWPVNGYASVSVQASSCLAAGAISSIAMLKGKPDGHGFLRDTGLAFLGIDHEGRVIASRKETGKNEQAYSDIPSPDRYAVG